MAHYEIIIESINPCGGDEYSDIRIVESDIQDPVEYVKRHTVCGELTQQEMPDGSIVIILNEKGYIKRFTFSEDS